MCLGSAWALCVPLSLLLVYDAFVSSFCSAKRKQVRVSLESILDVSTGERPWRASFGEANPDVSAGPEPELGRRACTSYVSDAERRKIAEGQLQSAQYLHRELPVRLAQAVTALDKVRCWVSYVQKQQHKRKQYLSATRK